MLYKIKTSDLCMHSIVELSRIERFFSLPQRIAEVMKNTCHPKAHASIKTRNSGNSA